MNPHSFAKCHKDYPNSMQMSRKCPSWKGPGQTSCQARPHFLRHRFLQSFVGGTKCLSSRASERLDLHTFALFKPMKIMFSFRFHTFSTKINTPHFQALHKKTQLETRIKQQIVTLTFYFFFPTSSSIVMHLKALIAALTRPFS